MLSGERARGHLSDRRAARAELHNRVFRDGVRLLEPAIHAHNGVIRPEPFWKRPVPRSGDLTGSWRFMMNVNSMLVFL